MKKLQYIGLTVLASFIIMAVASSASAAVVDCSEYAGTISEPVNLDVNADTDCLIISFVDGNVYADGHSVIVGPGGVVDGNITQKGNGFVEINGGQVNGTIVESGPGAVNILDTSTINGNIEENDDGFVIVNGNPVFIMGNIKETGEGGASITLNGTSVMNGKSQEEGPGGLGIDVNDNSLHKGDAHEKDSGDLTTFGFGTFEGNSKEEDAGVCCNGIADFKGNPCEPPSTDCL